MSHWLLVVEPSLNPRAAGRVQMVLTTGNAPGEGLFRGANLQLSLHAAQKQKGCLRKLPDADWDAFLALQKSCPAELLQKGHQLLGQQRYFDF